VLLGGDLIYRLPQRPLVTAAIINIGVFGAVTVGSLLGGLTAYGHGWRAFYAGLAGIGLAILFLALLTLPDQPPRDPDMAFDLAGIGLARPATVLPFWGVGELTGHGFNSAVALIASGGRPLTVRGPHAWIKENRPAIGSRRLAQTIRSS
jgi:MFS family permease